MGSDVRELWRVWSEIVVAAGEDFLALATTSTSAFGSHALFLTVDSRGCLPP